jgi:hypothetical protein
MIEVVHDADEGIACFGDQRMHRLKVIEEAPPGNLGNLVWHFAVYLIRLPQRLPAQAVIRLDVSYDKGDSLAGLQGFRRPALCRAAVALARSRIALSDMSAPSALRRRAAARCRACSASCRSSLACVGTCRDCLRSSANGSAMP